MRLVGLAAALALVGCITSSPEKWASWQREKSALALGCTWGDVAAEPSEIGAPWFASCEGRRYLCSVRTLGYGTALERSEVACEETEASKASVFRKVAIDRLSLETSCPPEKVAVVREADWSRGGERAYRMTACGKPYVCTTAAGRTDCKAALAE